MARPSSIPVDRVEGWIVDFDYLDHSMVQDGDDGADQRSRNDDYATSIFLLPPEQKKAFGYCDRGDVHHERIRPVDHVCLRSPSFLKKSKWSVTWKTSKLVDACNIK